MKREGWQHGMVRSHTILPPPFNPRPSSKVVDSFGSPPTAGYCTKVLQKPTNHSKHTGRCRKARCSECHCQPVSKSRDKAKGAYKLKSCDVALNHRLVSWRVVDKGYGFSYTGISASGILGYLSGSCYEEGDDHYEDNDDEMEYGGAGDLAVECGHDEEEMIERNEEERIERSTAMEVDEDMEFYKVGFVLEYLDGEDWCVVREM